MTSPFSSETGSRVPTLRFFKGGIPRSSPVWDFLLTPAAPSFIERSNDPHHPPFRKVREKDGAPGRGCLTTSLCDNPVRPSRFALESHPAAYYNPHHEQSMDVGAASVRVRDFSCQVTRTYRRPF